MFKNQFTTALLTYLLISTLVCYFINLGSGKQRSRIYSYWLDFKKQGLGLSYHKVDSLRFYSVQILQTPKPIEFSIIGKLN